jgi:uncharacterized protein (UPF0333 family)
LRLKRAIVDFSLLLPTIIIALAVMLSFYFGFQALSEVAKEAARIAAERVVVVQGSGCKVAVIRQT